MRSWFIVTPEYPPAPGGVGDFSRGIAVGLAERGERVRVFVPGMAQAAADPGVEVSDLGDRFRLRSCRTIANALGQSEVPPIVLLQYVPQSYGLRGLNLPFLTWLAARVPRLWVMFHEVVFPFVPGQPLRRDLRAVATRLMLAPLASGAERCLVSTDAWIPYLKKWGRLRAEPEWMPVPSNLPGTATRPASAVRKALGLPQAASVLFHFGTYSEPMIAALREVVPGLLQGRHERTLLLLGHGGERFREQLVRQHADLGPQLVATGPLPAQAVADAIAACDAGIYPFQDGVSGRRTSLMAALELGVPALTTDGHVTEPLWQSSGAVGLAPALDGAAFVALVDSTLSNRAELARLAAAGQSLYAGHFARERCLEQLLAVD